MIGGFTPDPCLLVVSKHDDFQDYYWLPPFSLPLALSVGHSCEWLIGLSPVRTGTGLVTNAPRWAHTCTQYVPWHAVCVCVNVVTSGCPQPRATGSGCSTLTHIMRRTSLRTVIVPWSNWHFDWRRMTHSLHPSSNFPAVPRLCRCRQWCDIDPAEQRKWICACKIDKMCEQHCRLTLICFACECLWSKNEVIAGLEVFGGPPGCAPIPPVFWHVERLNYRQQTHKLLTQPSSSDQHC